MEQNYFKIGGVSYDVLVVELKETFNILYSDNSGRTLALGAPMVLDPLGTFIGHNVKVKRKKGHEEEFDRLYDYILKPRFVGIPVEIVHNQDTISYTAYISSGERQLQKIDVEKRKVYWGELSLNIVPISAQVIP